MIERFMDRGFMGPGIYGAMIFFPWDGIFMGQFSPSVALKMYNNSPLSSDGFSYRCTSSPRDFELGHEGCSTCSSFIT